MTKNTQKANPKKLAIFLTDLGGGGAERVMVNLANGFAQRGYPVDLLLVKREGVYLSQLSPAVNLIDLNTQKLLLSIPKLVQYLQRDRPNTLLTALEDTNVIAIAAHLLTKRLDRLTPGQPNPAANLIVTVHNNLSQEAKSGQSLKRKLIPKLLKWIYPFADSVVAVSQGVAADLIHLGIRQQQVNVIYNPILTPNFETLATAELSPGQSFATASQWLTNPEIPVIVGIGRLAPQKDFKTLIRAIALAQKEQPLRLLILGEGSEQPALETLIQQLTLTDSIIFTGFVDNPLTYLARADLCVLSSAWEGFGNVLVEAMGVGTPVVSTDCPSGPSEILAAGTYGKLVPVGNPNRLAHAILTTLKQPPAATLLKRRAADFSVERVVTEYEKLLT